MKEDSRSRLKTILARAKPKRFPTEIQGYSLARILIYGLILPAIVLSCMGLGMVAAFQFNLSLPAKFMVLALTTVVGFTLGTIVLLKTYHVMLRFAKVKGGREK